MKNMGWMIGLCLLLGSFSATAETDAPGVWVDANGMEWVLGNPVRTTHRRAEMKCRGLGYRLPVASEFLEAVDMGLLDPKVNESFEVQGIDWAWLLHRPDGLSFRPVAWRYGEVTRVPGTDRHWALCVKRAS